GRSLPASDWLGRDPPALRRTGKWPPGSALHPDPRFAGRDPPRQAGNLERGRSGSQDPPPAGPGLTGQIASNCGKLAAMTQTTRSKKAKAEAPPQARILVLHGPNLNLL